jgi:hypothetical protein
MEHIGNCSGAVVTVVLKVPVSSSVNIRFANQGVGCLNHAFYTARCLGRCLGFTVGADISGFAIFKVVFEVLFFGFSLESAGTHEAGRTDND